MCREDKWIQPVKITIKIEAIDAATTVDVDVLSLDNIIMIYYTATHWIDIVTSKTVLELVISSRTHICEDFLQIPLLHISIKVFRIVVNKGGSILALI